MLCSQLKLALAQKRVFSAFVEIANFSETALAHLHQNAHFQQMVKMAYSMKELETSAAEALRALLKQVPAIKIKTITIEPPSTDRGIDVLAHITVSDRRQLLVCEVKANGQPRHVKMALLQLRNYVTHLKKDATPILVA